MKGIIRIFAASMLAVMTSCHFLEVEQLGKSDIEGYFSEVSAYRPAMYGTYSLAYGVFDSYMLLYPEVAADELVVSAGNSTWAKYQDFTNTSSDEAGPLGYIWKNGYQVIHNCNQIINHAPKLLKDNPHDTDEINDVLAQAYFVRGWMHFMICLAYGQNYTFTEDASHPGCAIVDHVPALTELIPRSSVSAVYSQVLSDISKALETFPENLKEDIHFATPLACKALLARIYLYMGRYDDAIKYADAVIAARDLVPHDAYVAMFEQQYPDKDESIFRLDGLKAGKNTYKFYYNKEPVARPSQRVKELLSDVDDIRSKLLVSEEWGSVCRKYFCSDKQSEEEVFTCPIVLRVSEMYLVRSEAYLALGRLNEAAADIASLRTRAYGRNVQVTCSDPQDLERMMEEERIRELCFEGHRLWDITRRHKDLVRTSDTNSTLKTLGYPDYRFVLPIPQVELDANSNIVNNPESNN